MDNLLETLLRKSKKDFSLNEVERFPRSDFTQNLSKYAELETWYSGEALNEYLDYGSEDIEKYPIKVNPLRSAVLKHAYALFGEYPDESGGSLVIPKVKMRNGSVTDETRKLESMLYQVWSENNGGSSQMEAGIMSQIYGGAIFRIGWAPFDTDLSMKIKIELIRPEEFMGIPYDGDPWRLREAWIIRKITRETAAAYSVYVDSDTCYYIEHWTPELYDASINELPIYMRVGEESIKIGGPNPFGFVPFVYIPHDRAGKFYGTGIITDAAKGLVREINARSADAGDAVSDDTHALGVMKNVRGAPRVVEVAPGVKVIDLGVNIAAVGGEGKPELEFPSFKKMSDSIVSLNDSLYGHLRRELFIPGVADGEDEGSQRSAVTLSARMWPLVSHIKQERVFWSTGLRVLSTMILKIWAAKGIIPFMTHTKMRISHRWHSVLPRDRDQLINELSLRASSNIGSLQHLLELVGDVENVEQEVERIKEWMVFEASLSRSKETEDDKEEEQEEEKQETDKSEEEESEKKDKPEQTTEKGTK